MATLTMRILVSRLDSAEQSIIYARYLYNWTWGDHHELVDKLMAAPDGGSPPDVVSPDFTYTIVDWRGTRLPVNGMPSLQYRKMPENVLVIIILTEQFAHSVVYMGIKIRRDKQFCACRTAEEAERLVNQNQAERGLPPINLANWIDQQQPA